MPLIATSILSALVLTYIASRLFFRLFATLDNPLRLAAAHLASWLLLAAVIGVAKAYFSSFAVQQTLVLPVPQLWWLCLDLLRGLGEHRADHGIRTRGSRFR